MISSRGVRWSGAGLNRGRQRLTVYSQVSRTFSINAPNSPFGRPTTRLGQAALRIPSAQQSRSISLFGWKFPEPADKNFNDLHKSTPVESAPSPAPAPVVKAVHATSDTPDIPNTSSPPPSVVSHPTTPEPKFLHDLENAIATPSTSTTESFLADQVELSAVPESIGYLKDVCGLDYGWGPTALLEFCLENIHIYTGFSWAASIVTVAFLSRLVILRFTAQASDVSAKLAAVSKITAPLRDDLKESMKDKKNRTKTMQIQAELREIHKEYGIKLYKGFLPIFIQVPLQYGGFRLLRGMTALPVPALETEKWLWATDLTIGDPFYILPLASAGLLYLTIQLGGESGSTMMQGPIYKILKYVMPGASFLFMYFQPGAVQLFFFSTSSLALLQAFLMKQTWFRSMLRLHALPVRPKTPAPTTGGTASTYGPGGFKMYQDAKEIETARQTKETEEKLKKNLSIVDKFVDSAKERKEKLFGGFKETSEEIWGKAKDKQESRSKDSFTRKAEAYEASRRREEEWQRESRNRKKSDTTKRRK